MKKYRTPLLTLDPNATAGGGLTDVYLAADVDARIAELEKALRDVKRFFEDERWGTVQYMESSDVYSDKDKALAAINSVL